MTDQQSTHYDHESAAGDPTSELRDALAERGFKVTLAHTGGGCMSVDVLLGGTRHALVGADGPLDTTASGGYDLFDEADSDDPYLKSGSFFCAPGEIVETIHEWIDTNRTPEQI